MMVKTVLLTLGLVLGSPNGHLAQQAIPLPVVQDPTDKKTIASPSGRFELTITPLSAWGAGQGSYVLKDAGQIVWQGKRDFFLRGAVVNDAGAVAGYSMNSSLYGFSRGTARGDEKLFLWYLDPTGTENKLKEYVRHGMMHSTTKPYGGDPQLYAPANRAILPILGSNEKFPIVDMTRGELLGTFDFMKARPKGEFPRLYECKAIRGTDLTALAWEDNDDLTICVTDLDAKALWSQKYKVADQSTAERTRVAFAADASIILPAAAEGHFAVHVGAERIEYVVNASTKEGLISEVRRDGYDPSKIRMAGLTSLHEVKLDLTKTIKFQSASPGAASKINNVWGLITAGPDRFAYLENSDKSQFLVLVDTKGNVLKRQNIKPSLLPDEESFWSGPYWMGGDNFLFSKGSPKFTIIDLNAGKAHDFGIAGLDRLSMMGTNLVRFSDGSIAVNGDTDTGNGMTSYNAIYDKSGKRIWTLQNSDAYFVQSMAVDSNDRLLVLDNIRSNVYVLDKVGQPLRTINLATAGAGKFGYPSEIVGDPNGGFIISDFQRPEGVSGATMFRFDKDGKYLSSFRPKYPDGRNVDTHSGVLFTADGGMWSSDGYALLQLDQRGVVKKYVGAPPQPNVITEIASFALGPSYETFIVDSRTRALHAFNPDGSRKYISPLTEVQFAKSWDSGIEVSRDGSVYIDGADRGEAIVGPDGQLAGFYGKPRGELDIRSASLQAGDANRWISEYDDEPLKLTDSAGTKLKGIAFRSDGAFIGTVTSFATSWDGTVCFSSVPLGDVGYTFFQPAAGSPMVNIFTATGNPVTEFRMPEWCGGKISAFDGKRVFVQLGGSYGGDTSLVCFDLNGKPLWKVAVKAEDRSEREVTTRDGKYLVRLTKDQARFYALPE